MPAYPTHICTMTQKCDYKGNWNEIEVKYNFYLIDISSGLAEDSQLCPLTFT